MCSWVSRLVICLGQIRRVGNFLVCILLVMPIALVDWCVLVVVMLELVVLAMSVKIVMVVVFGLFPEEGMVWIWMNWMVGM